MEALGPGGQSGVGEGALGDVLAEVGPTVPDAAFGGHASEFVAQGVGSEDHSVKEQPKQGEVVAVVGGNMGVPAAESVLQHYQMTLHHCSGADNLGADPCSRLTYLHPQEPPPQNQPQGRANKANTNLAECHGQKQRRRRRSSQTNNTHQTPAAPPPKAATNAAPHAKRRRAASRNRGKKVASNSSAQSARCGEGLTCRHSVTRRRRHPLRQEWMAGWPPGFPVTTKQRAKCSSNCSSSNSSSNQT